MPSMRHKQTAFAALDKTVGDHILAWTIRGTAKLVREAVGCSWTADDYADGWLQARRDGMRVVKIEISVKP